MEQMSSFQHFMVSLFGLIGALIVIYLFRVKLDEKTFFSLGFSLKKAKKDILLGLGLGLLPMLFSFLLFRILICPSSKPSSSLLIDRSSYIECVPLARNGATWALSSMANVTALGSLDGTGSRSASLLCATCNPFNRVVDTNNTR